MGKDVTFRPRRASYQANEVNTAAVDRLKSTGQESRHGQAWLQLYRYVYARVRNRGARPPWRRPLALAVMTSLAASLILLVVAAPWPALFRRDVVHAMDQAVAKLTSYHGVLEMRMTDAAGREWLIRRVEVWSDGPRKAFRLEDGTLTVDDGSKRWQERPAEHELVLLPSVGQLGEGTLDLRAEADRALEYPHELLGYETVAGRRAAHIKIEPPGGRPYDLWIDAQTKLPLRLTTAMQNAIQTTYTFVSFEANRGGDPSIFAYPDPKKKGYQVIADDPGQVVTSLREAAAVSGVDALLPGEAPARIVAFRDRVVLDYGETLVAEKKAEGPFVPAPNSALGRAAGGPLEVWWDSLRWRQAGLEIAVKGPRAQELAAQLAGELTMPQATATGDPSEKADVKVPVDLSAVRAQQQQVDGGHSPWWLDPAQVAMAFVHGRQAPGTGAQPQPTFTVALNTGAVAVVEVDWGSIERVYLKRLVRQDETGIWTVVGYDSR